MQDDVVASCADSLLDVAQNESAFSEHLADLRDREIFAVNDQRVPIETPLRLASDVPLNRVNGRDLPEKTSVDRCELGVPSAALRPVSVHRHRLHNVWYR